VLTADTSSRRDAKWPGTASRARRRASRRAPTRSPSWSVTVYYAWKRG